MALAAAVALGVSLLMPPRYEASMRLFVSAGESATVADPLVSNQLARDRVASYAELIKGEDMARRVVDTLGLEETPGQLARRIEAEPVADTVLIAVVVMDTSPERALDIAQVVSTELRATVERLEAAGGQGSPVRVAVADPPRLPEQPSSPRTVVNVLTAAAFGLLIGAVIALVIPVLDRSVRTPERAAQVAGAPVIGMVRRERARPPTKRGERPGTSTDEVTEDFGRIRANLEFLDVGPFPVALMVTSAARTEGASRLALGLGLALVRSGRTVTLVDADLHRSTIGRRLEADAGLAQVLGGEIGAEDAIQSHGHGGLSLLPAGPARHAGASLLESESVPPLLRELRKRTDVVLIDAPPVLTTTATAGLASLTDGVVLAVRHGNTPEEHLAQAAAILGFAHARVLGVVLTDVPPSWGPGAWAGALHPHAPRGGDPA
jgi:receptor protein-tyrosine kinase